MATKQEIMAALLAQKEAKTNKTTGGDNASFPFWDIGFGETAIVRFLPDGNKQNTFFWEKKESIKLPFDGVEGGDYPTDKQVTVTVPCMDMWDGKGSCPIIAATKHMWKTPEEPIARLYWKKASYIFQGFIVKSTLEEKVVPENPIRRLVINPSLFEIIERSLMDPEMEDMPTDYVGGVDFRINKTKKGDFANYSTSDWARKTRSLGQEELDAIEQYGLFNLNEFIGKKPDADELAAIVAMFKDSLAGNPFDYVSYGRYYKPYGDRNASSENSVPTRAVTENRAAPQIDEEEETVAVVETKTSGATANAQEIIERIKNRTQSRV
jgi:hypothetical protein